MTIEGQVPGTRYQIPDALSLTVPGIRYSTTSPVHVQEVPVVLSRKPLLTFKPPFALMPGACTVIVYRLQLQYWVLYGIQFHLEFKAVTSYHISISSRSRSRSRSRMSYSSNLELKCFYNITYSNFIHNHNHTVFFILCPAPICPSLILKYSSKLQIAKNIDWGVLMNL